MANRSRSCLLRCLRERLVGERQAREVVAHGSEDALALQVAVVVEEEVDDELRIVVLHDGGMAVQNETDDDGSFLRPRRVRMPHGPRREKELLRIGRHGDPSEGMVGTVGRRGRHTQGACVCVCVCDCYYMKTNKRKI